jgi:hypothetical protein
MLYKVTDYEYRSPIVTGIYRKRYIPGEIVIANTNTLGLMLFTYLRDVKEYISNHIKERYRVLRVRALGPVTRPKNICICANDFALDTFYEYLQFRKKTRYIFTTEPPRGTVCCYKIKVLKEIKI